MPEKFEPSIKNNIPNGERRQKRGDKQSRREINPKFEKAKQDIYAVTFDMATERPAAEGDAMVELKEEELSYYQFSRLVSEEILGFKYSDTKRRFRNGRLERQRPSEIKDEQTLAAHAEARDIIADLVDTRVEADKERLVAIYQEVNPSEGSSLAEQMDGNMDGAAAALEDMRFFALQDAVDWFGARVNQVETLMSNLTIRTPRGGSVKQRIEALQTNSEFNQQITELKADIELFNNCLDLEPYGQDDKAIDRKKARLKRQVDRAKRLLQRFEKQQADLKKLINQNDKFSVLEYEVPKKIAAIALDTRAGTITDTFLRECEGRLDGFNPDEEKAFWSAMVELFDQIAPREDNKDTKKRADLLRTGLHLFNHTKEADNLNEPGDITLIDEGTVPQNVGQLIERCKVDAKTLVEVREAMRITFAIMGRQFERSARTCLVGFANADKVGMVEQLNKILKDTQSKALVALTKDPSFKALMGDRQAKDLKWKKADDQVLITQIRERMHGLIGIGTMDKIDLTKLTELMTPAEPVDAAAQSVEGIAPSVPVTEIAAITLEQVAEIEKIFFSIGQSTSAKFREVVRNGTSLLIEGNSEPDTWNTMKVRLENIAVVCRAMRASYEQDWFIKCGLMDDDNKLIYQAMANMQETTNLIEALALDENKKAVNSLFDYLKEKNKTESGDHKNNVFDELDRFKISKQDLVAMLLIVIPNFKELAVVKPFEALLNLKDYLYTSGTEKVGRQALVDAGLVTIKKDSNNDDIVIFEAEKIRAIMASEKPAAV